MHSIVGSRLRLLGFALTLLLLLAGASDPGKPAGPTLLIVSLDGIRHDYPDRIRGGGFQRLEREGLRAQRLIPPFPASTLPVHATLATGCYPERHGILNSRFLDSSLGEFDRSPDPKWLGCEPIWINAERNHLTSAVLNWVGSFESWEGREATYHDREFTPSGDRARIGQVLSFLKMPRSTRPRLVMAYLSGADHVGHETGPDSEETDRRIRVVDHWLSDLLRGIDDLPDKDGINLIVVSDHGMAQRVGWIDPQAMLNRSHIRNRTLASGGSANVYLERVSDRRGAMQALSAVAGLEIFPSGAQPADLHYQFPGRTGDLVLVAPPGIELGRESGKGRPNRGGVHGYRGTQGDMGGIFYAWGPVFPRGGRVSSVDAVDVYRLACKILGLRASERSQGKLPPVILIPRLAN